MVNIVQTLVQLVLTLGTLIVEVGQLAFQNALLLAWVAWWLWGVNWTKAWGVLARGGWVAVVLIGVVAALVWATLAPGSALLLDLFEIGNFWWQLGAVTSLILLALFCGWVQGKMGWAPADITFDPPAATGHGHHHGHH